MNLDACLSAGAAAAAAVRSAALASLVYILAESDQQMSFVEVSVLLGIVLDVTAVQE